MRQFTRSDRLKFLGRMLASTTRSVVLKIFPEKYKERIRDRQFSALVNHAYNNVPFYKSKYDACGVDIKKISSLADIALLPTIEKSELLGREYDLLCTANSGSADSLFTTTTSGTSGDVLTLFQSIRTIVGRALSYHRAFSAMAGIYWPWYKLVYVYTSPHPFTSILGFYRLRYVSSISSSEEVISTLVRERPHIIGIYPSILRDITSALSDQELYTIQNRLVAITTNSEASSQKERDDLAQIWGVPVLDEYSSEEIPGVTASQCINRTYHIDEEACFLEIESPQGTTCEGQLVATSLLNWEMPIIRYKQGDSVRISKSATPCECGSSSLQLDAFTGRENDAFTLESGRVLTSGFLLDVGYKTLLKYSGTIRYWSLVQVSTKEAILECQFVDDPGKETISSICHDVCEMLPNELEVSVLQVDTPRKSKSGKLKQIVSQVPG